MINQFTHIVMLAGLSGICCLHGSLNAQEPHPELPAWAAGTITRAEAYEKNQADQEYADKVRPNLPDEALVKPAKPRKLLVFHNPRNYRHTGEVLLRRAVVEMGEKTGANTATVTDDPAVFTPEKLAGFDAVFFSNVNNAGDLGIGLPDAAGCQALIDYVANGGGWAGNHASIQSLAFYQPFPEMVGGMFMWHPFDTTETILRNELPKGPLTAAYGEGPIPCRDEIFAIKSPPYDRTKQTVLLSIDWERSDKAREVAARLVAEGRGEAKALRADNDYAVSWIKPHGKGRVFYTSLGHAHETIHDPRFLKHMLAAIQYACGDIEHRTLTTTPTNSK
jgi:type 1 glutamine amidotransferase